MRKIKYLSSFIVAFIIGIFVMYNFGDFDVANSISNRNNKNQEYYHDELGNLWSSKDDYLKYEKSNYFVAPDGTYWENEYRYEQSLKKR